MKQKINFLFIALFCFSISLSAQESDSRGTAAIDENFCLTINADEPLNEFYEADISELGFESEKEAQNVFGMKSNNLITYTVDYANSKVIAQLHFDRLSVVSTYEWWSTYLTDLCGKY